MCIRDRIGNDILDYYQVGNEVVFNMPDGDITGKVHDIMQDEKDSLVIIKFHDYFKDFWKIRKIKARIIAKNFEGLKIANTSIVIKHGETGVFVVDQELNDVFVPVKVIGSNDTFSIVESNYYYKKSEEGLIKIDTLDLYDEIVTNGQSKLEGEL